MYYATTVETGFSFMWLTWQCGPQEASKLSHIQGKHFIKSSEALLFLLVSSISGSIHSLYIIKSTVCALSVCAVRFISTSWASLLVTAIKKRSFSSAAGRLDLPSKRHHKFHIAPENGRFRHRRKIVMSWFRRYSTYWSITPFTCCFFWSTETTATLNSVCWSWSGWPLVVGDYFKEENQIFPYSTFSHNWCSGIMCVICVRAHMTHRAANTHDLLYLKRGFCLSLKTISPVIYF